LWKAKANQDEVEKALEAQRKAEAEREKRVQAEAGAPPGPGWKVMYALHYAGFST
jgi:hypothetical protein